MNTSHLFTTSLLCGALVSSAAVRKLETGIHKRYSSDFQTTAAKPFAQKLVLKDVTGKNEPVDRDDVLNVDDKNWQSIVCRRCDSLIFPEDRVKYIEDYKAKMPIMTTGGDPNVEKEEVTSWWHSTSNMDFDTIGYAWLAIDNKKVLLCGDCEFGPLGLRSSDDTEFWVAAQRVSYADKPAPKGFKPRPRKAKKAKQ